MVERAPDTLTLQQGSKAVARFLGEWFVPLHWLPKTAVVTLRRNDGDTTVNCRATDRRWNVGIFDRRSQDRYRAGFRRLLDELESQSVTTEP